LQQVDSSRLAIKGNKALHSLKLYCQGRGDTGEERQAKATPLSKTSAARLALILAI